MGVTSASGPVVTLTPDPIFTLTLQVTAPSEEIVTRFAAEHLRTRGYNVLAPDEADWETPRQFCARLGIFNHGLKIRLEEWALRRNGAPVQVDRRGKSGRIKALRSHPAFDAFCQEGKRS